MAEITMGQLRKRISEYIWRNYRTQRAFAKAMKCSDAYVSAVLNGKSSVPLSWAELVGAKIEVRVTLVDWAKHIDSKPARLAQSKKCLACGEYHYGIVGLPCPKMTPVARGMD